MPCCAFAACIVGQLFLAFGAVKRALFGGAPYGIAARNAGVGWRLDSPAAPSLGSAPRWAWLRSRRAVGGFAFPAALELLVILGAVYGSWSISATTWGARSPPSSARQDRSGGANAWTSVDNLWVSLAPARTMTTGREQARVAVGMAEVVQRH
jgi:hypothetical protein